MCLHIKDEPEFIPPKKRDGTGSLGTATPLCILTILQGTIAEVQGPFGFQLGQPQAPCVGAGAAPGAGPAHPQRSPASPRVGCRQGQPTGREHISGGLRNLLSAEVVSSICGHLYTHSHNLIRIRFFPAYSSRDCSGSLL